MLMKRLTNDHNTNDENRPYSKKSPSAEHAYGTFAEAGYRYKRDNPVKARIRMLGIH